MFLFQEAKAFKYYLPKQVFKGKIQFGFDGKREKVAIELLSRVPANFKSISRFETNKDTLNFWHSAIENDSLVFKLSNGKDIDTATVFLRKKTIDSLKISSNITSTLDLKDTLIFTSNNPIIEIDTTKVNLIDKDSTDIPFQFIKDQHSNKIRFLFNKKHNDNYSLTLQPNAFSDIYNTKNDSLKYTFKTKEPEDYGSIILTINKKTPSPVIIELLSENKKIVIRKKAIANSTSIDFNLLPPGKYLIRGIIDYNNNNKWDTGSYLNKIQPEKVIYYPEVFNIRANWHINSEVFTIN